MRALYSKPLNLVATILGVLSALVTIFTTPGAFSPLLRAAVVAVTAGCVGWIAFDFAFQLFRTDRGLPALELMENLAAPYSITSATLEDLRWAACIAQSIYSGIDVIPEAVMTDWYKANPKGFFIIKSRSGHRVGNIDILPLKPNALERLISGQLLEREISGDCIYSPPEADSITAIYVESFVAVTESKRPNAGAAVYAISDFARMLNNLGDPTRIKQVYAIAASANGKKLLCRLGFDLIGTASQRRDNHDLYLASTSDIARNVLNVLGDRVQSRKVVELITALE